MRSLSVALLLALICLGLSGCNASGELEKQAYVLVLGVDRLPGGELELTAKIPRIGGKDDASQSEGQEGGDYLMFSAEGTDYAHALEALQWATPRQMNLSHIEMLVASRSLAQEDGFSALVNELAETPHLYTTARFVICEGMAREFIEAQQTVIGSRLSEDINATLDHYADSGYIPDSCFAEVYYASNSIYSDPTAIFGYVNHAAQDAFATALAGTTEDSETDTPMGQRFAGAALFRGGRMVGTLDIAQTRLLSLVLGAVKSLPLDCDGQAWELTSVGPADRQTRIGRDGAVTLSLDIGFAALDGLREADAQRMEAELVRELNALIALGQSLGTDPFGFAESAAGHFWTVPEWLAFNWPEHYVSASVEVRVAIERSGAN